LFGILEVGTVMIICNIAAIAFGKFVLPNPKVEATLPMPEMFGGIGMAGFTC